jgi:hypothetical protein
MRPMQRRITCWFTLVAMVIGIAMPAHAYARAPRAGDTGADLCTTAGAAQSTPGAPAGDGHANCDACCGCTGGVAPASCAEVATPAAAHVAARGRTPDAHTASALRLAFARGPPRTA